MEDKKIFVGGVVKQKKVKIINDNKIFEKFIAEGRIKKLVSKTEDVKQCDSSEHTFPKLVVKTTIELAGNYEWNCPKCKHITPFHINKPFSNIFQ